MLQQYTFRVAGLDAPDHAVIRVQGRHEPAHIVTLLASKSIENVVCPGIGNLCLRAQRIPDVRGAARVNQLHGDRKHSSQGKRMRRGNVTRGIVVDPDDEHSGRGVGGGCL
jgi:hypothetical protein